MEKKIVPPHVQDYISVFNCSYIELARHLNEKGNLTAVYNDLHIPFKVKRVFYLYDIPGGESRGAHAHKKCHQLSVCFIYMIFLVASLEGRMLIKNAISF